MECEVCGKAIYGRAEKVSLDGARLYVCSNCAQFTPSHRTYETKQQPIQRAPRKPRPSAPRSPRRELIPDNLALVSDYGKRIRKAREQQGYSHETLSRKIGERVSLLQKVETEKMVPDRSLITKLEHTLKIRLQEAATIQPGEIPRNKLTSLTLGDIAILQKSKDQ
jgi:putative transcription factor